MKQLCVILLIVFFAVKINAQSYPRWYLFPSEYSEFQTGIFNVGSAPDSTLIKSAAMDAGAAFAKKGDIKVMVVKSFYGAGSGTAVTHKLKSLSYDTSLALQFAESDSLLIKYKKNNIFFGLYGNPKSAVNINNEILDCSAYKNPCELKEFHKDKSHIYSVGVSEKYYYESSSWAMAEDNALEQIAEGLRNNVNEEVRVAYDQIANERTVKIAQRVNGFTILRRYYDSATQIYYVLARAKK